MLKSDSSAPKNTTPEGSFSSSNDWPAFLLNPQNHDFATGNSRQLSGNTEGLISLLVGIVFLVFGAIPALPLLINAATLDTRGITTTALVTNLYPTTSGSKTETRYHITAQFVDESSRSHNLDQEISYAAYARLQGQSKVTVRYDAGNPDLAELAGTDRDNTTYNLGVGSGLFVGGLGAISILYGLTIFVRIIIYQQSALVLKGTIRAVSGRRTGIAGYVITVRYQVMSPTGDTLTRTVHANRSDLRKQSLPVPGTPIHVAYVNDRMYRML